jgi:hypothetical protein
MLTHEVDQLLAHADELLQAAERETERPSADAMTHLICVNARQSITGFFTGFLMQHQVDLAKPVTMEGLLNQCKAVDPRFEDIDLTPVHCRCETHDNDYCLDRGQVDACLNIAQQARSLVVMPNPGAARADGA